ncbi:hypothetical protein GUK30_32600 [Rhizobium leguminosarum]|uniref:hypothetical protein n=1 Tax=Rhizobium ruizarguesonis TaxID=2081791 RepID=UPI0013BF61AB|nr:hypothetical protein [Rhizobium ruizarguesonis]NEI24088.1 hypothetical protein [Rhizobium ruizarguesonis]
MRIELQVEAQDELRKVFQLACRGIQIEMFSEFIDEEWHRLMGDEKGYERFCVEACGYVVPHSEESGSGVVTFLEAYENEFGKFPQIWFLDRAGQTNSDLRDQYIRTGEVRASWKCTATHNCIAVITPTPKQSPKAPVDQPAKSKNNQNGVPKDDRATGGSGESD